MARIRDVVFDCAHPASVARFWAAILDGYEVAPYDDEELARLRAEGIDDPEDDPSVLVESPEGGPRLFFNLVPEPKTGKNRVHLDLDSADIVADTARFVALGGTVLRAEDGFRLMADPEGNEFCVFG